MAWCCCAPGDAGNEVKFDAAHLSESQRTVPNVTTISAFDDIAADEAEAAPATEGAKGADVPEGMEFTVKIQRASSDEPLGCHLDIADGRCVRVCGIRQGNSPVTVYNAEAAQNGEDEIKVGDFIVQANSATGSSSALGDEIRGSTVLEMRLRRPIFMEVTVPNNKKGDLGLDLNYAMKGSSLVINKISAGSIETWSATNPDQAIKRLDHIVSIDDFESNAVELLSKLGESAGPGKSVKLKVSRPWGY